MKLLKKIAFLSLPLAVFVVLYIPYSFINSNFIVDWFGCGCNPGFNANDFTRLFWSAASLGATVLSFFCYKNHFEKMWLRVLHAFCILVITLLLSVLFCQSMMWK